MSKHNILTVLAAVVLSLLAIMLREEFFLSRHWSIEEPEVLYPPSKIPLSCVDAELPAINEKKSVNALLSAFRSCDSEFQKTFVQFECLSEGLRFGAFMTLVSSRIKQYGAPDYIDFSAPNAEIIAKILSQKRLECDTQAHLVTAALRLAYPEIGIKHLGIISPSINHVMVLVTDNSGTLLLDPTTSIVARVQIDEVLKGKPVDVYSMIDYYSGSDEHLEMFRRQIRGALRNGGFRESDIIYKRLMQRNG